MHMYNAWSGTLTGCRLNDPWSLFGRLVDIQGVMSHGCVARAVLQTVFTSLELHHTYLHTQLKIYSIKIFRQSCACDKSYFGCVPVAIATTDLFPMDNPKRCVLRWRRLYTSATRDVAVCPTSVRDCALCYVLISMLL